MMFAHWGQQLVDVFTRRHQHVADAAVRLIEDVEAEFDFDSGVRRVLVLSGPCEARYLPRDRVLFASTVRLSPISPHSQELAEFTFHEMGHAMVEHHELQTVLRRFTRRVIDPARYEEITTRAAMAPRPIGSVSGYGACDREEEFCETLAAYLTNRKTWRTTIDFNGERVSVRSDPRLRRKLDAIHELLSGGSLGSGGGDG